MIKPDWTAGYMGRGRARYALGDYDGAGADFGAALRLSPPLARARIYHSRGGARAAAADFDGAIADYNQALEIDPKMCAAYVSRGHARFHRRDPLAETDYVTAFSLDSKLAASEIIRVVSADFQRDPAAVLENCRKHIRISPKDFLAFGRRGLTRLFQGDDSAAELDIKEWLRLAPDWREIIPLLIDEAMRQRAV